MDYRLFQALNALAGRAHWLDAAARACATYGIAVFPIALVLAWALPGKNARPVRAAAVTAGVAALLALGANQVLNHLVSRPRPYAFHHVNLLLHRTADASFPSDHTAVAFAVAAALWAVRPRAGLGLAVAGAILGVSRVIAGAHYPGDVAVGAAVGVIAAALLRATALGPIGAVTGAAERAYGALLAPLRRMVAGRS